MSITNGPDETPWNSGYSLVDVKYEQAVALYRHHGFLQLVGSPQILFLPLATAEKVLLGI